MVRWARRGGFRIIGPNCFGVYSPEHGIPYGPFNLHAEIGSVGFISQSSGHVGKILEFGMTCGVGFSKAISLGNGADLGNADFLEYLALDPRTNIIGLYVEGPRDSRRLFETIRAASEMKPIVVWKGVELRLELELLPPTLVHWHPQQTCGQEHLSRQALSRCRVWRN